MRRKNGDRLVGYAGPFAENLYAAGTPSVHGLASKPPASDRVADARVGAQLRVRREDDRWLVEDEGVLGVLRWRAADDGRRHATTGATIRLAADGVLHVECLVLSPDGVVKCRGYVEPAPRS
jgi:hypothetical protein